MQPAGDHLGPYGSRHRPNGIRGDLYLKFFLNIRLPGEDTLLADEVRAIRNEYRQSCLKTGANGCLGWCA
jgi:hypothetical protein